MLLHFVLLQIIPLPATMDNCKHAITTNQQVNHKARYSAMVYKFSLFKTKCSELNNKNSDRDIKNTIWQAEMLMQLSLYNAE